MTSQYRLFEDLKSRKTLTPAQIDNAFQERIMMETQQIVRKMAVLPTSKESEALPELRLLRDVADNLQNELGEQLHQHEVLEKYLTEECFTAVAQAIIKAKIYNDKEILRVADALFGNLVCWITSLIKYQRLHHLNLLNVIIDKSAEYYKTNGKESVHSYPFGEPRQPDEKNVIFVDSLEEGMKVDCLKTSQGRKIWTHGVITGKEHSYIRVKYYGEVNDSFIQNKYFEIAPYGTKETDFEWRESLQVGDHVDYDSAGFRQTSKLYVVSEMKIVELSDGTKSKLVLLAEVTQDGKDVLKDFYSETNFVKVHSPLLAKPGTRSSRVNPNFDDSDDMLYLMTEKKPRFAIMRQYQSYTTSSVYFVRYINLFGEKGGFNVLLDALGSREGSEQMGAWVRLVQSMSDNLVEPFISKHGIQIFNSIKVFGLESTEKNLRNFSVMNLTAITESITVLAQRIFPLEKAREESKMVTLRMAFLCIKSDFLQKQLFGAKMLETAELKARSGEGSLTRACLVKEIQKEDLFEKIIKGHPSLISKGVAILRMLFAERAVTQKQMVILWDQIKKTDIESKKALITLLKEITYELTGEETKFILEKMMEDIDSIQETELELIVSIKRWGSDRFRDINIAEIVNEILWKLLQRPNPGKKEFVKELSSDFVRSLDEATPVYTRKIIQQLREKKFVSRNLKLLGLILKDIKAVTSACMIVKNEKIVTDIVNELTIMLEKKAIETYPPAKVQAALAPDFFNLGEPIKFFHPEDMKNINQRLKFFEILLVVNKELDVLFTFSDFEQIWKVLFKHCIVESRIMKWVSNVITNDDSLPHFEAFHAFFHNNISLFLLPNRSEFFQFIVHIFLALNIEKHFIEERKVKTEIPYSYYTTTVSQPKTRKYYVLQVPVEQLDGFPELWKLFLECNSNDLEYSVGVFIAKLASPGDTLDTDQWENAELYTIEKQKVLTKCLELLNSDNPKQINKAAGLLEKMIRLEEFKGLGDLRSFSNLKLAEKISVHFEKNSKFNKEKSKVTMMESETVAELIYKIANEYRLSYEAIGLLKNGEQISHLKAPSTLEQAGITNNETLLVNEMAVAEKAFVPLLDSKDEFTPQALAVFKEIFTEFSKDGKMTKNDLANMTTKATDGNLCPVDDERIINVFANFDKENKGYLNEEEFLYFYLTCSRNSDSKSQTVRKNLASLGYQHNLQTKKSMRCQNHNAKNSIRRQLVENPALYERLLSFASQSTTGGVLSTANTSEELSNVISLVEFLTPALELILSLARNPATLLLSAIDDRYLLNYRLTIIHSLLTTTEVFEKIFTACGKTLTQRSLDGMVQKILDFSLLEKTMQKYKSNDYNLAPILFKVWEFILTAGISEVKPEFVGEMRGFMSYFVTLKNKPMKKPKAKKIDGSTNKDEEEKEETNPEEENFKRIGLVLKPFWEEFVKSIDFDSFNQILVEDSRLLTSNLNLDMSRSTKSITRSVTTLLCASNQISPSKMAEQLADGMPLLESLIEGLLHPSAHIRLNYKPLYVYFSVNTNSIEVKKVLLSRLINCIKTQSNTKIHVAIDIASYLLVEVSEAKNSSMDLHTYFNLPILFKEFAQKLMRLESQEKNFDEKEDHNLNAIITFLDKIVTADQAILKDLDQSFKNSLLQFLFKNCLFSINQDKIELNNVLCKSKKSREAALNLLSTLCKGDIKSVLLLLVTGFGPLGQHLPDFTRSSLPYTDFDRRNEYGYLGIKNLGCICYMIAMLQQFYCTPAFRYGLLMADDLRQPEMVEVKSRLIDDNVFHQMQKMFTYLDCSKRNDFNPIEFCLSYKDHSGEPINCLIQQDAQEFLNMIFDKLEQSLKKTPFKGILESVYGGQTANVFTCKKCNFVRQNVELFYNLSLEVKNFSNITDSFEKFIKEEIISDYLCSNCKNRCDVSKRCFLKTLPNVFIIHLQKIIFDLDALINIKISSRYEFPMTMNVRKFIVPTETSKTKQMEEEFVEPLDESIPKDETPKETPIVEELKDEDFEYKLVGVVIHKGNAEFGHYTSLININRSDPNRKEQTHDFWFDFDDSRISPFDMSNFDEECFGSTEEKEFPLISDNTTSKSAYILVYDKVKKSDIKIHFTPENIKEKDKIISNLINKTAFTFDETHLNFETNFFNISPYIPPQYSKEIQEDNETVILEQQILSKSFISSFTKILYCGDLPNVRIEYPEVYRPDSNQKALAEMILRYVPYYVSSVLPYVEETHEINLLVDRIETSLSLLPQKTLQFFIDQIFHKKEFLVNLLLSANNMATRFAMSQYLSSAVTIVIHTYNIESIHDVSLSSEVLYSFGIINEATGPRISDQQKQEMSADVALFLIKRFLDGFVGIPSHTNSTTAKKLGHYFRFMNRVASLNKCVAEYFIYHNMLTTSNNFYNLLDSSRVYTSERLLTPLIMFHATLLNILKEKKNSEQENERLVSYYNHYVRSDFFEKVFKEEATIGEAVEELVRVVSKDDQRVTDMVASVALKLINRDSEIVLSIIGLLSMLKINDGLVEYRLHRILGVPRLEGEMHKSKRYLYGLGSQPKLKSTMYCFPSLFFSEKGLIEIMQHTQESKLLMIINFLTDVSVKYKHVLEYLCTLPGYNYYSASIFETWPDFVKRCVNRMYTYETYKTETKSLISSCVQNIEAFQGAIGKLLESRGAPKDSRVFIGEDEYSKIPLYSFQKRYLVGKTISSKMVFQYKEMEWANNERIAGLQGFVDRVSVMESVPTGSANLALPEDYDFSMRFAAEQNKDFWNFIDESQHKDGYDLVAVGDEEEENIMQTKPNRKKSEELEEMKGCFFNENYIFRLNSVNQASFSLFAKIRILHTYKNKTDTYEITTDLQNKVLFVLEKKPETPTIGEVKIYGAFQRTQDSLAKNYDETLMNELKLLVTLNL